MPLVASKYPFLSSASWRKNPYTEPDRLFVPDFDANVMLPPPAWPNSGLNPLVSTWNSVIASSDGVRNAVSTVSPCRLVLTEMPSSVAPNDPPCPPPSDVVLPLPRASGTVVNRSKGLRIAPPTTSGSSSIRRFDTVVATFASSVCTTAFSATTSTDSLTEPRFNVTSTRAVVPAFRITPSTFDVWNPCNVASMRYVPGGRFVALYVPDSDDTTLLAALVAVLMTTINAPGTAAFEESITTPVMVPRSVCADATNGTA